MTPAQRPPKNVDQYIAGFPSQTQQGLKRLRRAIRRAAPEAEETISYGMPAFKLSGQWLLGIAAYKNHISLYPAPAGSPSFNQRLAAYRAFKSTIRFPLHEPIPLPLVAEIVRLRIKENRKEARERARKNKG